MTPSTNRIGMIDGAPTRYIAMQRIYDGNEPPGVVADPGDVCEVVNLTERDGLVILRSPATKSHPAKVFSAGFRDLPSFSARFTLPEDSDHEPDTREACHDA